MVRVTARISLACATCLLVLTVSSASAAVFSFATILSGANEAPPVATSASGVATLVYDDVAQSFDLLAVVVGIELADLAPNPGQFHLHGPAAPGSNAGVIVNLGVLASWMSFPFPGGFLTFELQDVPLPPANEADLLSGLTYLNVHTMAFRGGELRGNLQVPEPATLILLSLGVLGVVGRRRRLL